MMYKVTIALDNKNKVVIVNAPDELEAADNVRNSPENILRIVSVSPAEELRCYHKGNTGDYCGNVWYYSGIRERYATCSRCYKQVVLAKARIKEETV